MADINAEDVVEIGPVSLLFFGDFAPIRAFELMSLDPSQNLFAGVDDLIAESALSFVNLETVLAESGEPIRKDGPHLRAHPDCAGALARAGVTVAGLANNHIMDFGPRGLDSTLAACARHGLITCGAGPDISAAQQTPILQAGGVSVALIAAAEEEFNAAGNQRGGVAIADPITITRRIRDASPQADIVVVTVHGGNELYPFPRPGLRQLCHFIVEMGAHAVICHHNHMPSPYEYHLGRPIVYGLGNLLFDHPGGHEEWGDSYGARLSISKAPSGGWETALDVVPLHQSVVNGGVRIATGDTKKRILRNIDRRREILDDPTAYAKQWTSYCGARRLEMFSKQFVPLRFKGMGYLSRALHFERWFMPRSLAAHRLNGIRCESHRDVLISLLEEEHGS